MDEFGERILTFFETSGVRFAMVVLIAVLGYKAISKFMLLIKYRLIVSKLDNSLVNFVLTGIKVIVYTGFILYLANLLDISTSGLMGAISAVTLAIGLSIQNVLSSVANGIMLVTTRPFKVNDFVDIGGITGTVQEVTMMHTIINTADNQHVFIPNSTVYSSRIMNYSANDIRRLVLEFGVDYSCDFDQVMGIIRSAIEAHPAVLKNPAYTLHYAADKDSSVTFTAKVWVRNEDYWNTKWDFEENVFRTLAAEGVEIPFPQITVSYRQDGTGARPLPAAKEDKK